MRADDRQPGAIRPVSFTTDFTNAPLGSALIDWGSTKVLCTASLEDRLPPWMRHSQSGWLTGEYSLLPGSTNPRNRREAASGRISGRTQEIQRLIARSLRQAVNLDRLGQRQFTVDCDVLQADGGTRTAAITGGWVALAIALGRLIEQKIVKAEVLGPQIAAVSVGIWKGEVLVDLDYREDSSCEVDANFVFARGRGIVEVQATGEKGTFSRDEMTRMLDGAFAAAEQLFTLQEEAVQNALA